MNSKDIQDFYLGAKEEGARATALEKEENWAENGLGLRSGPGFGKKDRFAKTGASSGRQRRKRAWPDRQC